MYHQKKKKEIFAIPRCQGQFFCHSQQHMEWCINGSKFWGMLTGLWGMCPHGEEPECSECVQHERMWVIPVQFSVSDVHHYIHQKFLIPVDAVGMCTVGICPLALLEWQMSKTELWCAVNKRLLCGALKINYGKLLPGEFFFTYVTYAAYRERDRITMLAIFNS